MTQLNKIHFIFTLSTCLFHASSLPSIADDIGTPILKYPSTLEAHPVPAKLSHFLILKNFA
jgi:hypothetical protein